jgi:hypothetical protein
MDKDNSHSSHPNIPEAVWLRNLDWTSMRRESFSVFVTDGSRERKTAVQSYRNPIDSRVARSTRQTCAIPASEQVVRPPWAQRRHPSNAMSATLRLQFRSGRELGLIIFHGQRGEHPLTTSRWRALPISSPSRLPCSHHCSHHFAGHRMSVLGNPCDRICCKYPLAPKVSRFLFGRQVSWR